MRIKRRDYSEGLPDEIVAAIMGCNVMVRSEGRVYVDSLCGGGFRSSFEFSPETAEKKLRKLFPELSGDHMIRAVRWLHNLVNTRLKEERGQFEGMPRKSWLWDY